MGYHPIQKVKISKLLKEPRLNGKQVIIIIIILIIHFICKALFIVKSNPKVLQSTTRFKKTGLKAKAQQYI